MLHFKKPPLLLQKRIDWRLTKTAVHLPSARGQQSRGGNVKRRS